MSVRGNAQITFSSDIFWMGCAAVTLRLANCHPTDIAPGLLMWCGKATEHFAMHFSEDAIIGYPIEMNSTIACKGTLEVPEGVGAWEVMVSSRGKADYWQLSALILLDSQPRSSCHMHIRIGGIIHMQGNASCVGDGDGVKDEETAGGDHRLAKGRCCEMLTPDSSVI